MVAGFKIGAREIGVGHPCFIIAEAGVNHNGSLDMAYRLIDVAAASGADAVKFQTFKAEKLISPQASKAAYQLQTTDVGESQLDMVKRLELSFDNFQKLYAYCQEKGVLFMSTPFDEESVDFLIDLGISVFKIPSGEITNLPFLAYVAGKGKPMIISTGMSYLGEVETAVQTIEKTDNHDIVLLQCVSNYPADPADVNLSAMQTMSKAFNVPIGYSDHTLGIAVSLAAVALGSCVIEKHFTLDCSLPGPDHQASLEPQHLKNLVQSIRSVEASLGHGRKEPAKSEFNTATVARRSLIATQDIQAGTVLTEGMISIKRPGIGLPPAMRPYLIGRIMRVHIPAGTLFTLEMLA